MRFIPGYIKPVYDIVHSHRPVDIQLGAIVHGISREVCLQACIKFYLQVHILLAGDPCVVPDSLCAAEPGLHQAGRILHQTSLPWAKPDPGLDQAADDADMLG